MISWREPYCTLGCDLQGYVHDNWDFSILYLGNDVGWRLTHFPTDCDTYHATLDQAKVAAELLF